MRGLTESFFTAAEIRNADFHKINLGGYKPEEVRSFLDEVASQSDALRKENADLMGKIELLAKSVEKYRSDEDSIRDAFISAQKVGDSTVREARHKAEIILKTAQEKADALFCEARNDAMAERQLCERLRQETLRFRENIIAAYRDQIRVIGELQLAEPFLPETEAAEEQPLPELSLVAEEQTPVEQQGEEPEFEENLQPIPAPIILKTEEPDEIGDQFIGLTRLSNGSDSEEDAFGAFKRKSGVKARKV